MRFVVLVAVCLFAGSAAASPVEPTADEFQLVDAEGNWSTKADELEWIADNEPHYDSLVFTIRRLEVFENGTAIVAGTGTVRGSDEQGPYVAEYQSTNVLIKRDGQWRAIASHVSGYTRSKRGGS